MKQRKLAGLFLALALVLFLLASGISVDHTEEDVKNSIILFCTENLSE